jgi:subtilisin family serine protease
MKPQGKRRGVLRQVVTLGLACAVLALFAGPGLAQVAPAGAGRGGVPGGGAPGGGGAPSGSRGTPGAPTLPSAPLAPGLDKNGVDGPPNQATSLPPHIPDLLCVTFSPSTSEDGSAAFARSFGLSIVGRFQLSGLRLQVFLMRLPAGADFTDVLRRASADRRALAVQPDFEFATLGDTSGAQSSQYALQRIHADRVPSTDRGRGVTVALIDSGVDTRHESLQKAHISAIDVIQDGAAPPPETHGTVMASIIAGSGKARGLAPEVDLLAIRAFSEVDPESGESKSDSFHVAKAVSLALDRHARIINLSLAGPNDPLVRLSVEQAVLTGTLVIAAAGNGGPDGPTVYPAAQRGVIAVTATDNKDRLFSGASHGDYIALAAPGVAVFAAKPGTQPGGAFDYFTGTSMATGYATGLAALLLAADPHMIAPDILKVLETSAVDLGPPRKDPEFGWGRIDAAAAFAEMPQAGAAN